MPTLIAHDTFGLPVHLERPDSLHGVDGFIEGFLGYEPRILDILGAAEHDDSLIVQTLAAALQLFSEAPGGPAAARAHLQRAAEAGRPASTRERRWAEAVAHWAEGRVRAAIERLETIVRSDPRDLAAVKLGQYLAFNLGDSPTMLRLALQAVAAPDHASHPARLHGLLAFAWEQCHGMDQAEAEARAALALRPDEPWAQHALAHVMLTDGRLREGLQQLQAGREGWQGLTSFMRTHNWWHLAVFHIELGEHDAALALYDQQVWGVDKTYSQDQVGAVALLARLELVGVDVGARWQELAGWLAVRVHDQVQPFLDLQYLYGLARAGSPRADDLLAAVRQRADQVNDEVQQVWQQVAVPACHGLLAHAQGRWTEAVQPLGAVQPQLLSIGGSHAQRDLFEQLWLDALERSGQLASVMNVLQPRAETQPQSRRLARQLARLHQGLGLPAF